MGLKLRGAVRCGRCGKPRGIRHTCVIRAGRRQRRHKVQSPVTWECGTCHKQRGLVHACRPRSDFRKRRRQQAAAERRARDRARKASARSRPRQGRPRGDGHEPGTCGNRDCERYGCQAYFAGVENCPLPHGG